MPLMQLKEKTGRTRWIYALVFSTRDRARSFVSHSLIELEIIEKNSRILVCSPEDAKWAVRCGYRRAESR
jgi:hypothetical protein